MEEANVFEEASVQDETAQQASDLKAGFLSQKEAKMRCCYRQMLAFCFITFCIFWVLGIIRVTVHQSKNEKLTVENQELKTQNQKLEKHNQELEGEKNILKQKIENLEKTQIELNVSRAQWSIDAYCPKETERKCRPCQKDWFPSQSSCYAYNNAKGPNQRSFDEAQKSCHEKDSHLTIVTSEQEKYDVSTISLAEPGITGYWIGLKAVKRKWKWVDGTELTNQKWINPPTDNSQCVTTLKDKGWTSVSCDLKNAWICEKKTLSV